MIKIRNIVLGIAAILFILGSGALTLTPWGHQLLLASLLTACAGYGVFLFYFQRFPLFMRFLGIALPVLFTQSMVTTHFVYGQSYLDGFSANLPVFLAGMAFLLYFLTLRYSVPLDALERVFLSVAWAFFLFILVMKVADIRFILGDDKEFGVENLSKGLLNLGACIYLDRFFRRGNFFYLLLAILFFSSNFWVDFQRAMFLIILVSFAVMLYNFRKRTPGVLLLLSLLIVLPVLVIVLGPTEFGASLSEKFGAAAELFQTDNSNLSDESIDARVRETEFALESIQNYPVFGIGKINGNNLEALTGIDYFYLTDIGVLGILSCFGLTGILVFLVQWRYWFRNYRWGNFSGIPTVSAYKIYLLFLLLHSLFSGITIHLPAEFLLVVALVEIGKLRQEHAH